jgi:tetratricopeptide (TPR) repeat protein
MSEAAPERDWLRGKQVAISGRLASMSRSEAAALIATHGGQVVAGLTRTTDWLLVGQGGEPLDHDGRLTARLQKAQQLQRRGYPIGILPEEDFLAWVGLDSRGEIHRLYTTIQMCRILRLPPQRLRSWLRVGLVQPVETVQGIAYFDYQQVSWARTLCELTRAGVRPEQIRRSLEQLRRWLPVERPLAQLGLLEQNGQLLVRLESGQLAEPSGQRHFDFAADTAPEVVEAAPRQRTAEQWFETGCDLEVAGHLPQAADAYRQALLVGGPDANVCYNLANVLYHLGDKGQAAERYRQAVEVNPGFAEAWNNLGNVLGDLEQYEEAIAAYRQALKLNPQWGDAHYNLAVTLDQLKRGRGPFS